jgi:hypothetical protein
MIERTLLRSILGTVAPQRLERATKHRLIMSGTLFQLVHNILLGNHHYR